MKLSVIIPTKNRPEDLIETLRALGIQTRQPDELIIVDQSRTDAEPEIRKVLGPAAIPTTYIWDRSVTGLPMARNTGFSACTGEIVCYLDDDTTPAPDYLAKVEEGFSNFPEWDGLCGRLTDTVVVKYPRRLASSLFRVGIFADDRSSLVTSSIARPARLLPGAACCFRRHVLQRFSFDEELTGYALGEDVEFCLRAGKSLKFGVYPHARVHHRRSETARPPAAELREMARKSASRLWRTHRRHLGDDLCYLWLCFGLAAERLLQCKTTQTTPDELLHQAFPRPERQ
ncbi:MAG TPA: glycosyltransferase [Blastocatellia bacterium]